MEAKPYLLLHVADPLASARFFAGLLEQAAVEEGPTFALFALPGGTMLGLWSRQTVEPATAGAPGCAELGLAVADEAAVDRTHAAWRDRGVTVLQEPTGMDFGRSFTAQDPDGHRIRVFALPA